MKQNDHIETLFERLDGQFDTAEPRIGHQQRFLEKLHAGHESSVVSNKQSFNWWKPLAIAASFALVLGFFIGKSVLQPTNELADISPQLQETQFFFSSLIETELKKVKLEENDDNREIIADALDQLNKLEVDYEILKQELLENGDDKRLVHAMITNFQNRITLLENVLQRIEAVKQFKNNSNEDNII
ncbi:hypothetical protein ACFQ1M_05490 [Sungkyunkwania multivorans]|uniref:Anti-sigma factor n=1 Tax=Sungkyunkwania multivorans TaxID=1173618 RepID=A0ABW3CXQ0_9FLAO